MAFIAKVPVCKAVRAKINGRPPAGTFSNEQHLEFLSPADGDIRAAVDPKRFRVDSARGIPWFGSPAPAVAGAGKIHAYASAGFQFPKTIVFFRVPTVG